ncbi:MAG: RnfABCDGE type electron transport complex subunit D [Patescibacteria group bacterium]|nr:RnfABCDGE type electron transport complex subunit D [Patescibacteria group bacterium]MDE2437941.1 RnfABCDGE type electron transport complex subunit D [Patescibacteria group bacterium]
MFAFIDTALNRITMYRLVLYYLIALLGAATLFSMLGVLPYDPTAIVFSTIVLLVVTWITNRVFAHVFHAQENAESVYITAFILALIISPVTAQNSAGLGFLIFAGSWSMACKYLCAIRKKHIFNPAAFAVALSAIAINQSATWWVGGNLPLLPLVVLGGILVVRKIQKTDLVLSAIIVALGISIVTSSSKIILNPILQTLLHSSLFFFSFVMLTEPLTTPPGRTMRILYGAIVGALFVPAAHIGSFYFTPELALLAGNIFSYAVSPKERLLLSLRAVEQIGTDMYDFIFRPDHTFSFRPGQYLEWTLSHASPDDRGNRRYFTIASSPTEQEIRLGVKFYPQGSSFKRALAAMKQGDTITASQLAGEFTLPRDPAQKLVFIAGGIGITPFRSMLKYLIDMQEHRPITLFYANKKVADIAYKPILDEAWEQLGIKTVYSVTAEQGPIPGIYTRSISAEIIAKEIPDYCECTFYISGPRTMVIAFEAILNQMGVPRRQIKVDFFPGFA